MAAPRPNVTAKMKARPKTPAQTEADRAEMSKELPNAIDTEAQSNVKMNKLMSKKFRGGK